MARKIAVARHQYAPARDQESFFHNPINRLASSMVMLRTACVGVFDFRALCPYGENHNKNPEGRTAPPASAFGDVVPDEGGFVTMLVLDMDSYAEKYGNKAVRKNLTIPAWLNTFAEANHINFSHVLQDSLTALYQKQQT